jgi:hypothetical protein
MMAGRCADHEWTAADALGAPVGEGPPDLLLERQDSPGPATKMKPQKAPKADTANRSGRVGPR